MLTRTGVRRQETERVERVERARAAFEAVPNDVIVSIFSLFVVDPTMPDDFRDERARQEFWAKRRELSRNLRWLRETFPLVCRAWNALYCSQQASPLHGVLEVDFRVETPWRTVRAAGVLAFARRHTGSVRKLRVLGLSVPADWQPNRFSSTDLATLYRILAPNLAEVEVGRGLGSLVRTPFWRGAR